MLIFFDLIYTENSKIFNKNLFSIKNNLLLHRLKGVPDPEINSGFS